jgi:phosphoribosylformimino-5-aminoimidazole carboxamide ribotide isomerase
MLPLKYILGHADRKQSFLPSICTETAYARQRFCIYHVLSVMIQLNKVYFLLMVLTPASGIPRGAACGPHHPARKEQRMKFRPCIDLHEGKVKQIVGSTLSDTKPDALVTNFATDLSPAYFAGMYKNDGLSGGHIIMLGPGNEDAALTALHEFPMGFHIGGGITQHNASRFLSEGASHVIVTSCIFKDGRLLWENLEAIAAAVGKKHLVLDLSCQQHNDVYFVATDRWQRITSVTVSKDTLETLGAYCDEFLIHAAHIEGRRQGIDRDLVSLLAAHSPVPATYAGGIRSLEDLELVNSLGDGRVDATVGSALDIFGGSLSYRSVVEWHYRHQ